ncbi:hypothetical protein L0222_16790 [bacterium]|nr:hypothetical protein [bacterium]MCI0556575.1 hypothetical protein [Anaerolineae bacterium]
MRVHKMFGEMTDLVDQINSSRAQNEDLSGPLDEIRKKIVATKEGGAITGEARLREHTDALYGAILSYEGRPAKYQIDRIEVLEREINDVKKEYQELVATNPAPSSDLSL